ncbi:ATP-dependent helicase [Desulfatitalea tepidiphila]|uniref:ATP-dependent helicase n=1 Tax=Desulfatitalea tepidiphila TaxID=1185843 RepID=UPI0006B57BD2|nr:ATP-dependent helicase [Desulfatitalea tepidiphila]
MTHSGDQGQSEGKSIQFHELLNPEQLEAVTFGDGPLLVIAGAGSGKTRTLTHRVAHLVQRGVAPNTILLLSFTRKASQEMLRRASELLDRRCREVAGGTFHSFSNSILRRYSAKIGFPQGFSIMDRSDAEDLIGFIRKALDTTEQGRHLPRKSTLATLFSRAINKNTTLEEIIYEDYPHFGFQIDLINKIWIGYQNRKRELSLLDFDDLLVYFHRLLSENPDVRDRLTTSYTHILVDEYQDTNFIQAEIVSLLAGKNENIMVVGDDAQSIYAFRGANYKNIIEFPNRFPGTRLIKLEENYRSLQPILDLANAVIEPATEKYSKCLFTRRGGGDLPVLVASASENAQSRYVTQEILRLRNEGVALDRIAVLFRASFQAFDLEVELNRAAISYVKVGGFKFTESAHIKDILAHLRIFAAPQDQLSWTRVLLLVEKIGPATALRIYTAVLKEGAGPTGLLSAKLKMKPNAGFDRLKQLIAAMDATPHPISRWGEIVLEYYKPYLETAYDDHPRRLRDLEQLISIMERYDRLDDFLDDMALDPPNDSVANGLAPTDSHRNQLVLSTIHSAKGLEWHTVFIIWALDGRFPSIQAIDNPDTLEEERRLMYVAITRAQQSLHITYPVQIFDRATQSLLYEPSRFLEDAPEALLKRRFFTPH